MHFAPTPSSNDMRTISLGKKIQMQAMLYSLFSERSHKKTFHFSISTIASCMFFSSNLKLFIEEQYNFMIWMSRMNNFFHFLTESIYAQALLLILGLGLLNFFSIFFVFRHGLSFTVSSWFVRNPLIEWDKHVYIFFLVLSNLP